MVLSVVCLNTGKYRYWESKAKNKTQQSKVRTAYFINH